MISIFITAYQVHDTLPTAGISTCIFQFSDTFIKETEQNGIRTVQTLLYRLTRQCCCNTSAGWQADIGQRHSFKSTGTVTILFKRNWSPFTGLFQTVDVKKDGASALRRQLYVRSLVAMVWPQLYFQTSFTHFSTMLQESACAHTYTLPLFWWYNKCVPAKCWSVCSEPHAWHHSHINIHHCVALKAQSCDTNW